MRKLETTTDLLDALLERYGWTSDRQIALALEIPQQTVSSWRIGRTFPTEVHAFTLAEALEIPPLMVLAIAAADRTEDRVTREKWQKLVRQVARSGFGVLAALAVGTAHYTAQEPTSGATHLLRQIRRRPSQAGSKAA